MLRTKKAALHPLLTILLAVTALSFLAAPATGADYAALKGVKGLNTVFDVSQGNPKVSNIVFWAVTDVYLDKSVRALPNPPRTVVVFHGPAVKLITNSRKGFSGVELVQVDEFQNTIRQMKKDGVTFEICLYAAKVMGVNPADIMAEFDHVGNGFVSVAGYQAQGYSMIRIP